MKLKIIYVQKDNEQTLNEIASTVVQEFQILNEYCNDMVWTFSKRVVTSLGKKDMVDLILSELITAKKKSIKRNRYENVVVTPDFAEPFPSSVTLSSSAEKILGRFSTHLGGDGKITNRRLIISLSGELDYFLDPSVLKEMILKYYSLTKLGYIVATTDVLYDKYFSPTGLVYGWIGIYSNELVPTYLPSSVHVEDIGGIAKLIVVIPEKFDDTNEEHLLAVERLVNSFKLLN